MLKPTARPLSRRRMRALAAILPLCLCLLLCPGCGKQKGEGGEPPQQTEVTLAIGHDCPEGAQTVLQAFCDDAARLSGGSLKPVLQHWENPLESNADLMFVSAARLGQIQAGFTALRTDYIFSSYEHLDTALTSQKVLDEMSRMMRTHYPYTAYSVFYCGRRYLVSGENSFTEALRGDDSSSIKTQIDRMIDPEKGWNFSPAVFPLPNLEKTLYYAATEQLSALSPLETQGAILVNNSYRYDTGVLFFSDSLPERLGKTGMAALYESAAMARPACNAYFLTLDAQAVDNFSVVLPPSQKLRRAIRDRQTNRAPAVLQSSLYQLLDNYTL